MMEHRSSVIVFRSNAIDNNYDDEKMIPNDVNEEAADAEKKDEPYKEKFSSQEKFRLKNKTCTYHLAG